MYEQFEATDRWSGQTLSCRWKANIVALATRHANAVDVLFDVNGRSVAVAMPTDAWAAQKARSGKVITDHLAIQIAGRHLKQLVEDGADLERSLYAMSLDETLAGLDAVVAEAKQLGEIPVVPAAL